MSDGTAMPTDEALEPNEALNTEPANRAAPGRIGWWRRNRLWLALLLPLLALALIASSFRLFTLYLPWQWSAPIVAGASEGTLTQRYLELDGVKWDREVTVRLISLEPRETTDDFVAVKGAMLWAVNLEFEASPDQFLDACEVGLGDAEGNRYDFRSGIESANADDLYLAPVVLRCVPEDAPGPTVAPFSDEVIESPIERPRTWTREFLFALPTGVTPTEVRVAWHEPVYLVLTPPTE
ncbi:hypothetical protein [Leucobacter denitrificans]|uniref:Uncharacterized protein n=1 Tax=Leucobacter denitrificans TaxID=683042 RepID=A0A7G9S5E0_9MICO|nr:hypothetical protein [Leucobacter denitrificans]QNN63065.1 hypothetical protein H9L06_01415 [Leucobacter denitrificans]